MQATLDFAVRLLMSEAAYSYPGLRPALGRLSNAMVAALGPELQRGSPAFKLCKSVIREMQVTGPPCDASFWLLGVHGSATQGLARLCRCGPQNSGSSAACAEGSKVPIEARREAELSAELKV
jgi:hypothetical protein